MSQWEAVKSEMSREVGKWSQSPLAVGAGCEVKQWVSDRVAGGQSRLGVVMRNSEI